MESYRPGNNLGIYLTVNLKDRLIEITSLNISCRVILSNTAKCFTTHFPLTLFKIPRCRPIMMYISQNDNILMKGTVAPL